MIIFDKESAYHIKIFYYRVQKGRWKNMPRKTEVIILNADTKELLGVGVSTCNMEVDQCVKKIGRRIALQRAIKEAFRLDEAQTVAKAARIDLAMCTGKKRLNCALSS